MAPEILDSTANVDNFFSFKAADMFSSSYIIWEMMQVCVIDSEYITCFITPPFGGPLLEPLVMKYEL